jgi:two-component system NarL family response regulator
MPISSVSAVIALRFEITLNLFKKSRDANQNNSAVTFNRSELSAKVIIMTTFEGEEDVHRSMKAGAHGYLLKDSTQEEILDAIRRVSAGESYLPARIVQKVAEGLRKPKLSPRELEVLHCVALGKSNKEIGVQLFIAEGTVKTHINSFLEKLGAVGRTAAVREAVHRGLVRLN